MRATAPRSTQRESRKKKPTGRRKSNLRRGRVRRRILRSSLAAVAVEMVAAAVAEMAAAAAATVVVAAESGTAQFTAPHSQINHALTARRAHTGRVSIPAPQRQSSSHRTKCTWINTQIAASRYESNCTPQHTEGEQKNKKTYTSSQKQSPVGLKPPQNPAQLAGGGGGGDGGGGGGGDGGGGGGDGGGGGGVRHCSVHGTTFPDQPRADGPVRENGPR